MIIALLFISFSAYAVMWTLQFHFTSSVFRKLDSYFWNPSISWQNKWKTWPNGLIMRYKSGKKIEKFLGSSTVFVWLTDAFHLFQFVFLNSLMLAFGLLADGNIVFGFAINWWLAFLGIRAIYAIVFEGLFGWLLIKK